GDPAGAEGGGFDHGAIDLLGAGREGEADERAGKVGIHEGGAAAVEPVYGENATAAGRKRRGGAGELFVRLIERAADPIEGITDGGLAGFVTDVTGEDAILDDARDAGDEMLGAAVDHVAGA